MDYDQVHQKIIRLKEKYKLVDFHFDTEAIYQLGDLSGLLKTIIDQTIPNHDIEISERYSTDGERYIATLSNKNAIIEIFADTDSDWLPDTFTEEMESIPDVFESKLKYYSINPAIGLTGQDAWYFCGTEDDLKDARKEGIPLIFPGEDVTETQEFKDFNS